MTTRIRPHDPCTGRPANRLTRHAPRRPIPHAAGRGLLRPGGVALLEIVVSVSLFAVVAACVIPLLARINAVRSDVAARETALREVRNLAEQALAGSPPEELTLTELSLQLLEAPLLEVITPENAVSGPATLSLSWINSAGQRGAPVRLLVWPPREDEEATE